MSRYALGRSHRLSRKVGQRSCLEGFRVYIGRSRDVHLADLSLLDLWSTVVLELHQFRNAQQHPSRTRDARELASCASDTGRGYGSSGKTSPNDRIPDANVWPDGQGSDGRLHRIGSKSSVGVEQ